MTPIRLANVPDLSPGDPFVDLTVVDGRAVEWCPHSGVPANALERRLRRPRLARYRAAWAAASDVRWGGAVVSHLPRMTLAIERVFALRRFRRPHLAFSFNFTDLPRGADLRRFRAALAATERFCVYSEHEARLYPEVFGLPADRFRRTLWTQDMPTTTHAHPVPDGPFVVAIGGEARDYAAIVAAARARLDVRWLAISRPTDAFAAAPPNLTALFDVPGPVTWGIAERAAAVVVPLLTDTTRCGHLTIVSAQLLGLPLVTTRSQATRDYVDGVAGTTVVEPGDGDALAQAAADAIGRGPTPPDPLLQDFAKKRYSRRHWKPVVEDFLRELVS